MTSLLIWITLFIVNLLFGLKDIKNQKSGFSPAFTWFATGLSFQGFIFELAKLFV